MVKAKIKNGLKKASKAIEKYSDPSTYTPFYPIPTDKSEMELQEKRFEQSKENWENNTK